jgi:hypothetical protein
MDGQDVSIYECIRIDISMLAYRLYNLTFPVPVTNGYDN